jgi:hypothetical protein
MIIMISLLIDFNTQDYNIIIIHKSWRNFFVSIFLNSHQCDFHLLYKSEENTRMCFYVNDKLDTKNWKIQFSIADFCVLTLILRIDEISKTIRIYNVYNSFSTSYAFRDSSSTLSKTNRILFVERANHHFLLEDFNLHHLFWSDLSRSTQHVETDQLLDMMIKHDLTLILSKDTITWKIRNTFSIIDLIFAFNYLTDRIKHCMIRSDMRQSSNHILIFTRILLDVDSTFKWLIKRRVWKLLNIFKLKKIEKETSASEQSQSSAETDDYIEKIQQFLQKIIDAIIFWAILSRYVKSFWNSDCDEITKKTRRLKRIWSTTRMQNDWKNYMQSNDRKQKIIQKVKKLNFRQKIEKTIDTSTNLWRLARWTKDKSHSFKEISKMSTLKFNDQTTHRFDQKIEMFKNIFFSSLSSADLFDIKSSFYSTAIECSIIITENQIVRVIDRIALDKASRSNDILNRLIKTCSNTLIRLLILLFQICVVHDYLSKAFKTINIITLKKIDKSDYITSKTYQLIVLLNIIEKILKSIMSKKISWLAKTHRLLSKFHMNVKSKKFIETTLELLTKQIHIVWEQNTNRIIILLSLNVVEAFDIVFHSRLIHNLRKRKISQWIIIWVSSFMNDWSITLIINRRVIEFFAIFTNISQNSSVSFLLYLFYNANLLKMCDRLDINTRFFEYVDDVNILTYDKSIEEKLQNIRKNALSLREMSVSTWFRLRIDQIRADTFHEKLEKVEHDDHH